MTAVRYAPCGKFYPALLTLALLVSMPLPASAGEAATMLQNKSDMIRDNLFLLEEAYNQEPGVIQHIQSFSFQPRHDSWNYTFTEEWPAPSDRHQLSLTVPVLNPGELGPSGAGDFLINYRLQAIGVGGAGRLAMAPRVSLVLPTGRYQTGAGRGSAGLQLNLPVSMELGDHFVAHLNAGLTVTPGAKSQSGYSASALDTSAGGALVWLPRTWINPLVEFVHLSTQEILEDGNRPRSSTVIANPGLRFAINRRSGLQIVPGISMPIQFGGGPRSSILFYLSLEHPLWRPQ